MEAENKKSLLLQSLRLVIRNYFDHDVGKNAAALAYFLLFANFPLLIFISNLLGLLKLDIAAIIESLQALLPADVIVLLENYLDYVSNSSSHFMLWFSLVFSVWFPLRAAKGLMSYVRLAYNLPKPEKPLTYAFRQLVYTLVLLLVIVLTLLFLTLGERALGHIMSLFSEDHLSIIRLLPAVWQYLRFFLTAVLMYFALGSLYAFSQDRRLPSKETLPGIVSALAAWLLVSLGFSFYVENFANYSVIYGTLGAVIVLLIWLYLTAIILILGAELNAAIAHVKSIH